MVSWRVPARHSLGVSAVQVALVYFVTAVLAIWLSKQPGSIAVLWYANAAVMPLLACHGRGRATLLLLPLLLACIAANRAFGVSWGPSLGLALANGVEVALAVALLRRLVDPEQAMREPLELLKLLTLPVLVSMAVTAPMGAAVLTTAFGPPFAMGWVAWFCSSAIGAFSVLPLATLIVLRGWRGLSPPARLPEFGLAVVVALGIAVAGLAHLPSPMVYLATGVALAVALGGMAAASVAALLSSLAFGYALAVGLVAVPPVATPLDEALLYLPVALALGVPLALGAAQAGMQAAAQRLERRERDTRELYQRTPALMLWLTPTGTIMAASDRCLAWMQYEAHEVIGRPLADFLPGLADTPLAARPQDVHELPVQWPARDGSLRDVELSAVWERDDQGQPWRALVVMQDATRRNQAAAALRRSEALLQRTNEMAGVGGWELDLRTETVYWSDQTCRIQGFPPGYQPSLQEALAVYAPEGRRAIETAVRRGIASGQEWDLELPLVRLDGESITVRTIGRVESENGVPVRLLGALQDVTAPHRLMRSLQEAKRAAEAASEAKGQFLANMSHEIRTPMNAVLGVAHLLRDTPLDANQRDLLDKLQLAGRSLLAIINDVLDLAKIEAGELRLEQIAMHPQQVLEEVQALVQAQAKAKGLQLQIACAPDTPALISSDPQRLRQILLNLASNAIKFTAQGWVRLGLRVEVDAQQQEFLCWEVADSGIGIPEAVQAQLFRPFVQADASTTRQFGGTGLGLAIVRELSQRLGGEVSLRSQPGAGSCFTVRLPLERGAQEGAPGLGSGLRIVVLSSEVAQRKALTQQCEQLGWQVEAVASSQALLERLGENGAAPDAILLAEPLAKDPAGLKALTQRLQGEAAHRPALLLLRDPASDAPMELPGVEAVLQPPVQASALFNAVNAAIVQRTGHLDRVLQATRIDALDAAWLPGVRVLVVDDSELNREVAQRLLSRQAAQVETVDSGEAALARLQDAAAPAFDAVLMDVQMPGMDGLEATRRLRQLPAGAALPVLALTAGALAEERQRAKAAGMDDFLTKPLEPVLLVRRLRHWVEQRRGTPLGTTRIAQAARPQAAEWPVIEGIDIEASRVLMGGHRTLFMRSLKRLLEEHLPVWDRWQAASEPPQPPAPEIRADWQARLHKLKGSAGQLGASALHHEAAEAERLLRAESDPATDAELLARLLAVQKALQALHHAAAPALAEAAATATPPEGPAPEGPAWQALLGQLQRNDLEALADYSRFLPGLAQRLGAQAAERFARHVANLRFPSALEILADAGMPMDGP